MRKSLKNFSIPLIALVLVVVIAAVCLLFIFSAETRIALKGSKTETVEVFSEYNDSGFEAKASMLFLSFKPETEVLGGVDTSKLGDYAITYKSSFFGKEYKVERKVSVKDTAPPVITVDKEEVVFEHKGKAPTVNDIKVEVAASDNYDGDITDKVEKSIKGNELILSVSDSSGNKASYSVNIVLNDGVQPTITLKGDSVMYLKEGSTFKDPGFIAADNMDGNLTDSVEVSGKVDTSKSGTYLREYVVTDGSGNSAKRIRKVVVYSGLSAEDFASVPKNGKTVYLTFDDGPGAYTEKLLGYLDRYDVKVTFFVTNQFSGYKHLIGEAHKRGHTIGVHTSSHKWEIYKSKESYLADFEKIQKTIEAQTGKRAEIFRFPGGTNNLVSKKQKKGIMTLLSKEMKNMGYVYFDWNVDCNDSRYGDTQRIIESTIEQISKKNTSVVLMHDIKNQTVEAVPAIIEYCLRKGYTFKALDKNSPPCSFKPQN